MQAFSACITYYIRICCYSSLSRFANGFPNIKKAAAKTPINSTIPIIIAELVASSLNIFK